LVVDDEVPILKLLKEILQSLGAEVLAVADSCHALEYVEQQKVDGIFLDINMPGLDGIERTMRIRVSALNKKVPIVILSGLDDAETMRKGFRAGASAFLGKPVTRDRAQRLFQAMCGPMLIESRD
jgi:CheY-like chemotaxis protein